MIQVKDIINYLEEWAPLAYQETYDNAGLILGDSTAIVTGVLICLDITEAILQEAKERNCNLIIAHHPIIFKPIKKITGNTYVERCIIQAIKQNLSIYILHTNLDNILHGVNECMARQLGLRSWQVLFPKSNTLQKLVAFLPSSVLAQVQKALHQTGTGYVTSISTSFLQPNNLADQYKQQSCQLKEYKLEIVIPAYLSTKVEEALKIYPEIEYEIQNLENVNSTVGSGIIGELPQPFDNQQFLSYVKGKMNLTLIRHSVYTKKNIKKVALCGGAGIFLLSEAIKQGADAFITADVKYHDFFDAQGRLLIADIGHYESEIAIKSSIYNKLSKKFSNIVLLESTVDTNPVHYF